MGSVAGNAWRNPRVLVLGLTGTLAAGGMFGLSKPAQAATCQTSGNTVTCTYNDPAAAETFVVPAGVTSVRITLQGGSGGRGSSPPLNGPADGGVGGAGGTTADTVAVSPGNSFRIYVGGEGADGQAGEAACDDGIAGGPGGLSGGIKTGGDGGGSAVDPSTDQGCVGGGGGGGSFVMSGGQTLDQGGAVPLLAAGGGGGGGGGSSSILGGPGGAGGGNAQGATAGGGQYGGAPGASGSVAGAPGTLGDGSIDFEDDGGGGGGGGYSGGAGGGLSSGGGGGAGRSPAGAETGTAAPGTSGFVRIAYSLPVKCAPGDPCIATTPAGDETTFKIVATGGNENATLFGVLNGGLPPTCKSVGGNPSPDWVQFGFSDPKDGKTWSKKIRVTGTDPTSKATAQRTLAETQICFAAPYRFVVKRGTDLKRVGKNWEGLLAHCKADIVAEAKEERPDLAAPCILNRSLVEKGDGWVVRVNYFVPNGELDPQGRSLRKKKKKRG